MTTERNIIIHAGQTFELSLDYAGTPGRGQRMHIRASDAADDVIAILTHNGADNARVIYNDATQKIDIRIGASVSGAWLVGANRVEWKYDIEDYDVSDDDDIDIPFRGASIVYGNRTRPEDVTPSAALPSGDGRYVRFDTDAQGLSEAQQKARGQNKHRRDRRRLRRNRPHGPNWSRRRNRRNRSHRRRRRNWSRWRCRSNRPDWSGRQARPETPARLAPRGQLVPLERPEPRVTLALLVLRVRQGDGRHWRNRGGWPDRARWSNQGNRCDGRHGRHWCGQAQEPKPSPDFTASDNQPPASSFATLDTRNSVLVLDFDDAAVESAVFVNQIPEGADLSRASTSACIGWRPAHDWQCPLARGV